ncbi:MAG: hypothetical protein AB8G05_10430 [Oligoflexales bacterium]
MRYLVSALFSIVLLMQSSGGYANLDTKLKASCKKWKSEAESLESGITAIDNDEFSLNAGIPGLMFYGMVISPFLLGSDFLFGREFREDAYENHKDAVDFFMIATISLVIFPYTLALNTKTLVNKVAVKKFLQIKLTNLREKITRDCFDFTE